LLALEGGSNIIINYSINNTKSDYSYKAIPDQYSLSIREQRVIVAFTSDF
jgi:hypothetical protein